MISWWYWKILEKLQHFRWCDIRLVLSKHCWLVCFLRASYSTWPWTISLIVSGLLASKTLNHQQCWFNTKAVCNTISKSLEQWNTLGMQCIEYNRALWIRIGERGHILENTFNWLIANVKASMSRRPKIDFHHRKLLATNPDPFDSPIWFSYLILSFDPPI